MARVILSSYDKSTESLHPFTEFRRERRSGVVLAFFITLLLHLGLFMALPEEILVGAKGDARPESRPMEVEFLAPEPIPPEAMRFVEANPDVPENEPDRQDQYSFRSQQAASETPSETELEAPNIDGEELESQKIVEGALEPAEPLPPGTYSTQPGAAEMEATPAPPDSPETAEAVPTTPPVLPPPPPPDFLRGEPQTGEGSALYPEAPGLAEEFLPEPAPDAPIDVYRRETTEAAAAPPTDSSDPNREAVGQSTARPMPRERPRLAPELIQGPLMRSEGAARNRGTVAIDATFSEFGEYQQQFYAAIQAGWYQEIEFFRPIETSSRVHVRFTIHSDGSIHDLEVLKTTAGHVATLICESAILKRSPFRPWTREMVDSFGDERTLNVVFHYR